MAGPRRLILAILLCLAAAAPAAAGGVPQPVIPKAKGTHCVRPVQWMRRRHMELLMALRHAAVHDGIRHRQESLPGCMNCHVSKLADGRYPSVSSPKFFCNACHRYAGVSIDCFSCHTNRPDGGQTAKAAVSAKEPRFAARDGEVALKDAMATGTHERGAR